MKYFLITIVLFLSLVSCSKEELIVEPILPQNILDDEVYGKIDQTDFKSYVRAFIKDAERHGVVLKDIDIESARQKCIIIEENVNPLSLLKHFSKVYTKTSGMGFEALLVGCECVCFGMPFYAGWGITEDKSTCKRRVAKRSIEEVFAAAYILYTRYYNPYTKKPSDVFDVIETIVRMR